MLWRSSHHRRAVHPRGHLRIHEEPSMIRSAPLSRATSQLVSEGKGKHTIYSLNRLCTIYAPYAQSRVNAEENDALSAIKHRKDARNIGFGNGINDGITGHDAANDPINEGLNEGLKFDVFRLILENPGCRVPFFIKRLSVSRATVERAVAALIAVGKVEHRGSKKTGGYYAVL